MATIVIKDLAESLDLDRQAMLAITGGARVRGRPAVLGRTIFRSSSLMGKPSMPAPTKTALKSKP